MQASCRTDNQPTYIAAVMCALVRSWHARTMDQSRADGSTGDASIQVIHVTRTLSGWAETAATADSACHVAGFAIRIDDTIRQRCAWCGEVLAVAEAEQAHGRFEFPFNGGEDTWQVGSLVRCLADDMGVVGIIWQGEPPSDACFVPRVN